MIDLNELPSLNRLNQLGSGGLATIHKNKQNEKECFKKFHRPILSPENQNRLHHMVAVDSWSRPSDLEVFRTRFSWPLRLYGNAREITGFSMPLAPDACWFQLQINGRSRKELLQLKYLTNASYWERAAVRSKQPNLSPSKRNALAIDIAETIQTLHRNSLVFGDISSNNACVNLTSSPTIFFLDADSIGSPAEVASSHVVTPDWETPSGLTIEQRDVSLTSLLIWRLFSEESASYPEIAYSSSAPRRSSQEVIELLVDVYRTGRGDGLEEISQLLRQNRGEQEKIEAINKAIAGGFARAILREVDPVSSDEQIESLVVEAKKQLEYEEKLDRASKHEYQKLLKEGSGGAFKLDVLPESSTKFRPNSTGQLRELILDTEFFLIAEVLAGFGLGGDLEGDPWLPRAVQHALVQVEAIVPQVSNEIGKTVISWVWPSASFVNSAYLEVETDGSEFKQLEITRSPGLSEGRIEVTNPSYKEIKGEVRLYVGVKSKSGKPFYPSSDRCVKTSFSVLPIPRPVREVPPILRAEEDEGSIGVFDPVQQAIILAEENERLRERRKYQMIQTSLASVAVAALVALGWYLYDAFSSSVNPQQDLVVVRGPVNSENSEIYSVDENGVTLKKLTTDSQQESSPVWSHDGKRIAFSRHDGSDWEIWVMENDGSNPIQLTDNDWDDREPAWHPNGQYIAFSTQHGGSDWEIYRLSVANSEDQRQLTNNTTDDRSPEYNLSGDLIFTSSDEEGVKGIFFLDGAEPKLQYEKGFKQPLFIEEGFEFHDLSWSTDGERIAYAKRPLSGLEEFRDWEIWVMDSDGENRRVMTWNKWNELGPTWFDNGERIAYSRYDGFDWEIWTMAVDGSDHRQLTHNEVNDKTTEVIK